MFPNEELRVYFKYQELLDIISIEDINMPRYPHDVDMSSNWFTKLIESGNLEFAVYTLSELIDDDMINQIVNALMDIVYQRHAYDYVKWVTKTDDEDYDKGYALYNFMIEMLNVLNLTIPRYIPLLQQNEEFSYAPVSPVHSKTTGRSRYNDTPQDEGEYNDEEHATNVSKSTSETEVDSGSIVSRLDELFKNWRSIILEWSNEFNRLFFKEEQL